MNEYRKPSETISNIGLADNEAIGENDYVQRLRNVPQVKLPLIDLGEVENARDGELDLSLIHIS